MALTRGELARKVVHMGVGTIAFSLRYLGPFWAAILAACALGMNLFVLPHIGGRKLRFTGCSASGTQESGAVERAAGSANCRDQLQLSD